MKDSNQLQYYKIVELPILGHNIIIVAALSGSITNKLPRSPQTRLPTFIYVRTNITTLLKPWKLFRARSFFFFFLLFFSSPNRLFTLALSLSSLMFPVSLRGSLKTTSFPSAGDFTRVVVSTFPPFKFRVSLLEDCEVLLGTFASFFPCAYTKFKKRNNIKKS